MTRLSVLFALTLLAPGCDDEPAGSEAVEATPTSICGKMVDLFRGEKDGMDRLDELTGGNCHDEVKKLDGLDALAACVDKASKVEDTFECHPTWKERRAAKDADVGKLRLSGPRSLLLQTPAHANFKIGCDKDQPFDLGGSTIGVMLPKKAEVKLSGPPNAKVDIDGVEFALDDKGNGKAELDPSAWFAKMTYTTRKTGGSKKNPVVQEHVDWRTTIPVTVTTAGGTRLEAKCEVDPVGYFGSKYYGLKDGKGLTWPWEKGDPPTELEGGWIETISTRSHVGEVKHPGDIDVVVIVTKHKERTKKCGPYGGGGKKMTKDVKLSDSAVTVYERRTGKVLDKKIVKARSYACPTSVWSNEGLPGSYAKVKESVKDFEKMVAKHLKK